jgi:hypothetical protein
MKSILVFSLLAATFFSCSTPYGPVGTDGGFTSFRMGPNIHKVVFSANGFTNSTDCEKKALYRCAELTLLDGFLYFEVLQGGTGVNNNVIYMPGQTTVNTNSYGHAYGNAQTTSYLSGNNYYGNTYGSASTYGNSYTTITSSPPTPIPVQKPKTTYVIRTTNHSGGSTYDAKTLVTEARVKKLKLDARVAAMMPAPEPEKKL